MRISRNIIRPLSLRQPNAALALGVSAALLGSPAFAQTAEPEKAQEQEQEIELDTLKVEGRTADVNPYAEEGAPYKARVSGDPRRVKPLAETPATINVITETRIEESGYNDFRAVLDAQPGVTVGTGEGGNQFGDRYIIRGQEARSDVFVDGLRDPGLQSRETFAIEQIEITKGPSATFAGRGASGGAVNAITKQAGIEYDFHNFDVSLGTDKHVRATIDSNIKLTDSLAVRGNLLFTREDIPDRDPARRKRFGAALAVNAKISEVVSLLVDYYHLTGRDRPDLGQAIANSASGGKPFKDIPAYAQEEDFQNANVNILTARLRIEPFEGFRIENATRYGRTKGSYLASQISRFNRGPNDPVAPGAVDYRISNTRTGWQDIDYFANRLNVIGEFETGGLKHNLVAGAEYTSYNVDSRNSGITFTATGAFNCINGGGVTLNAWCVTDGAGNLLDNADSIVGRTNIARNPDPNVIWQVDTLAGYLMDTVDVTNWLTIAGGVRFDAYDYSLRGPGVFDTNDVLWSFNASATFKPAEDGIVYLAWATGADVNGGESDVGTNCGYGGLCTATINGEVIYQGKPERSGNLELGAKWEFFDHKLLATAAIFQTIKKDLMEGGIDSYIANGTLNSGKHRVRGIELGLVGNITDRLSGQIGVTLMKSKMLESIFPETVGRRISNFANNSVDAQIRYDVTNRLTIGATATYQSEMFAGQPDTAAAWNTTSNTYNIRIPSYTKFDAFVSYRFNENLSLRLNALNLTDKHYYVAAYRGGSFAYLGDGRAVRLTLSGKF